MTKTITKKCLEDIVARLEALEAWREERTNPEAAKRAKRQTFEDAERARRVNRDTVYGVLPDDDEVIVARIIKEGGDLREHNELAEIARRLRNDGIRFRDRRKPWGNEDVAAVLRRAGLSVPTWTVAYG